MNFYETQDFYVLSKEQSSLWCSRNNGDIQVRPASSIGDLAQPTLLGCVFGIVGKIKFFPGSDDKVILIIKQHEVGCFLDEAPIYSIDKVAIVPLSSEECPDIEFQLGDEHADECSMPTSAAQPKIAQTFSNNFASLWSKATANKNSSQKIPDKEANKEKLEKLERRLQEELLKMFNDSQSFYYSKESDITNSIQRIVEKKEETKGLPLWKTADERFFWNKAMLEDIIKITETDVSANDWIVPIVQGYVQSAKFDGDNFFTGMNDEMAEIAKFDLLLISRRSVFRAGTRYKRRGVDENGNVANYVETEQIVHANNHCLSFVQTRGSIPLYWSQTGMKYKPPPKLERDKSKTVVNLVEQNGREQVLYDAFMEQIITYDNPLLTYVTFDFHEYCRGMKFENVSKLVEAVKGITGDMKFSWVDNRGVIWEQLGVFRVNCMDCLDRTNVVQAALARSVLIAQLCRLGRIMPEIDLPGDIRDVYQDMWANNGDAISRQYAGTAAMKGDFTRTGERRFTGVMKDGYHSANRYLNRFTAAYRQTVIDIMLGIPPSEDISLLISAMKQPEDTGEEWTLQREEWIAQLVNQCRLLLLHEGDSYIGGWALIEPVVELDGDGYDYEQEKVLLLSKRGFYIASYNEEEECVNQYEFQLLENLEKIELGPDMINKSSVHSAIRLYYRNKNDSGYFHTFKLLKNRTIDEDKDVLNEIIDEFKIAAEASNVKFKITECKINKKKSKPHEVIQLSYKSRPCVPGSPFRRKKSSAIKPPQIHHSASAPANLGDIPSSKEVSSGCTEQKDVEQDDKDCLDTKQDDKGNLDTKQDDKCNLDTKQDDKGNLDSKQDDKGNLDTKQDDKGNLDTKQDDKGNLDTKQDDKGNLDTKQDDEGNLETKQDDKGNLDSKQDDKGNLDTKQDDKGNLHSSFTSSMNESSDLSQMDSPQIEVSQIELSKKEDVLNDLSVSPNNYNENLEKENHFGKSDNSAISNNACSGEESIEREISGKITKAPNVENTVSLGLNVSNEKSQLVSDINHVNETVSSDQSENQSSDDKIDNSADSSVAQSIETEETQIASGLGSDIKRNIRNRLATVSMKFRKNEEKVNTPEIRLQSEGSASTSEPTQSDGKRNTLATAQEKRRALIPELKNKFAGLSNRAQRADQKRDWRKVIEGSGCRTRIIQI
ncbi:phosphatidylinositide phosphatase SAC2-like [Xenia sp. Carnegie-2017]|uniref:phosphatidylinositide phosphatase SAC2-like n=1 Tax=Xenia sp. Carnegie-2017 TaxID=2897299 RepID=UPI001F04D8D7|nr:phosphatidylinositide phosphatase SAC2-like [Xenia sp. Carnegie-2017]